MSNMNFYYMADIEIKADKMREYHDWWSKVGPAVHEEAGAIHVATFNVLCGGDSTTHVKRLFKITDLEAWARGEEEFVNHDEYWASLALTVKTTLLAPEPYSHLK